MYQSTFMEREKQRRFNKKADIILAIVACLVVFKVFVLPMIMHFL